MSAKVMDKTKQDVYLKKPSMYAVVIHNDEITTMDFVVQLLTTVFQMPPPRAAALMMAVHENGQGIAGVYVFDIAATKKSQAGQMAMQAGYPLKLTMKEMPENGA